MQSRKSNLSYQIERLGDIELRYARAAPYTWAKHAAPLSRHLVKCPQCLVLVDMRLHIRCPSDPRFTLYDFERDRVERHIWEYLRDS